MAENIMNQDPQNHEFSLNKTFPMSEMFWDIVKDENNNFTSNDFKNNKM